MFNFCPGVLPIMEERGRLFDKRRLFESGRLLDHLGYHAKFEAEAKRN